MENTKRLYRSESNRIIAGVCGGLGEYFEIDPTLLRIIFLLAAVFGGSGLVIYLVLWLLLPKESALDPQNLDSVVRENVEEMKEAGKDAAGTVIKEKSHRRSTRDSNWLAYLFIGIGAVMLLSKLGLVRLDLVWPLLLMGLGLLILFK